MGAYASIDDWNRAISENGEYIMFATSEKLQNGDENKAPDVYEWHNGTVGMISDGHAPHGVGSEITPVAAMSASGSDIFFATPTALVGQDTDVLGDVYDARTGGGFPRPAFGPSCPSESEEGCQGKESAPPSFGSAASSSFIAGGNLTPPAISVAPSKESRPKPLTRAQKLAKALKACRGKPRKKRAACEAQARRKYGSKAKAKKKAKAGKGERRTR
jgi:hypothetical protein